MDKFIKSIDDSLQRLQGRMAKIGTFCLFLGCYQQKLPSYMNDWIGLVANNCIQELHIGVCFISAEDIRRLKKVIVDELDFIDIGAFNLEILHCEKLSYELELSLLVCNNLKKLRLSSPITNQWIQEPFDKFQSLEILHLEFIKSSTESEIELKGGFESLENLECEGKVIFELTCHLCIPNLPKLKKVEVYYLDGIVIEASNLEILDCTILSGNLEPGALLCNNLKELIVHSNPTIINQCIQQVFAKFLQLETLHLDYNFSSYEPYRISIIISRHQLKSLGLSVSGDPEAIEINAPNLKSYRFSSKTVPSSLLMNASSLQEAIFELHMEDIFDIDTEWFLNLLKYLMMFKNHKFLCLTISLMRKENYEALLNGLLWCCHPKTLSVPLENERNRELLKFLYKAFTKEEDSFRRSSHCNWRHHLKDVKIVGLEVVDEKGLESLLTFEGYKVTFELTWGAEDKGLESLLTFEGYN
ncbi:hypothetical protein GH714_019936 [Hevea brasiliensis]|uniref:FBD domain-containing protein n=1 Tax=Hevea brasiliensis TaxID=3981 RepID=A0A6A6LKL3_HEVBR|nr:hypothetical protein GH714_019936 [Hevea brasiliensis]